MPAPVFEQWTSRTHGRDEDHTTTALPRVDIFFFNIFHVTICCLIEKELHFCIVNAPRIYKPDNQNQDFKPPHKTCLSLYIFLLLYETT